MNPIVTLILLALGISLQIDIDTSDQHYWAITAVIWWFISVLNSVLA